MNGRENQKYGSLGENLFEGLTLRHFSVVRPREDVDGWDFLLRPAPSAPVSQGFLDILKKPTNPRYWVQVKTLINKADGVRQPKRIQLPLSRLFEAARDEQPWFYFVIRHADDFHRREIFLIHIDEKWISRVARRMIEVGESDISASKMDISFDSDDLIEESGDALYARITALAGIDMNIYAAQKRQWWERAGLETESHSVSVITEPGEAGIQAISDLLLGRRKLEGAELRKTQVRFGKEIGEILTSNGVLQVGPAGRPLLHLSSRDEHLTLPAKLYLNSGLLQRAPNYPFIIRLDAEVFEILIYPKEFRADAKLVAVAESSNVSVARLETCWRLTRMLNDVSASDELVKMVISPVPGIFDAPLELPFRPDHVVELPEWETRLCEYARSLHLLSYACGCSDLIDCDPVQLLRCGPALVVAAQLAGLQSRSISIQIYGAPPPTIVCLMPLVPAFEVGNYRGYATGYIKGRCELSGDGDDQYYSFVNPEIICVKKEFGRCDAVNNERLSDAIEALEHKLRSIDNVTIINWPPMVSRSFIGSLPRD